MNVLFLLCEGQHDAQFIYRLLCASEQYEDPKWPIEKYPEPFSEFFKRNFQRQDLDSIVIGNPTPLMVPQVSLRRKNDDWLILVYTLGGQDKVDFTKKLLEKIFALLPQGDAGFSLYEDQGGMNNYALLFFFDADKEGRDHTLSNFKNNYNDFFDNLDDLEEGKWIQKKGMPLGLFIFTGDDGETGTLEDTLTYLFLKKNRGLVTASFEILDNHSDHKSETVAQKAARSKSALTICGQTEKDRAGVSLAVVVRHSKLLDDVFDFSKAEAQWTRVLTMIDSAFSD